MISRIAEMANSGGPGHGLGAVIDKDGTRGRIFSLVSPVSLVSPLIICDY
jgi:hypothetical protein